MPSKDLRSRRYRDLVSQLGEEFGKKHGWKRLVAEKLGVHPSYVTKVDAGDFGAVGDAAVLGAISRISLKPSFFTAKEGHYTEHVTGGPVSIGLHGLLTHISTQAERWTLGEETEEGRFEVAPTVQEARQFALEVLEWTRGEIEQLQRAKDAATKAVVAPDAEAVRTVLDLAHRLSMRDHEPWEAPIQWNLGAQGSPRKV